MKVVIIWCKLITRMSSNAENFILAIDPGRDKCGLAVLGGDGRILFKAIAANGDFRQALHELIILYRPVKIALGDGTGSGDIKSIAKELYQGSVVSVPEKDSTLEARDLAWESHPPTGIVKFLPKVFWPVPDELDAWAAVVIGRRALDSSPLD